jgi:hypothetical protein
MTHRYQSSCKQEQWLKQVVTRFFGHHAAPTDFLAIKVARYHAGKPWRQLPSQRSLGSEIALIRMGKPNCLAAVGNIPRWGASLRP